jgi:hypothetical protein
LYKRTTVLAPRSQSLLCEAYILEAKALGLEVSIFYDEPSEKVFKDLHDQEALLFPWPMKDVLHALKRLKAYGKKIHLLGTGELRNYPPHQPHLLKGVFFVDSLLPGKGTSPEAWRYLDYYWAGYRAGELLALREKQGVDLEKVQTPSGPFLGLESFDKAHRAHWPLGIFSIE